MKSKDPVLPTAIRILRALQQRQCRSSRQYDSAMEMVLHQAKSLAQFLGASHKAHARGWCTTAAQMQGRVTQTLRQLQNATAEAVVHCQISSVVQPTLRDVHQDLLQLHQEFEEVSLELKRKVLAITTDPITLDDVYLGPFRLELHFERLAAAADVSAFDIVALDPHPPSSSEDVTHPHVQDNQLCAGDATVSISHALKEGRICDAFLAVNSVLHTYNRHSPYVSLGDWEGIACADCGYTTREDQRYHCDDCGQDYCEECFSICDICQTGYCRGCLERDQESEKLCCKDCRCQCSRCNRMVDADSFQSETELRPGCHELHQQEQQSIPEENPHEHPEDPVTTHSSPETSVVPDPA